MTLPLRRASRRARRARRRRRTTEDKIESAYRFLLADLMPFGKNARIRLEHGGTNQSTEHYETVTYWYGLPSPSLVKTDELQDRRRGQREGAQLCFAGGLGSLTKSPRATKWGVDHLRRARKVYPAAHRPRPQRRQARRNSRSSSSPKNFGVLLRRKLDYAFPNQRAEVFVADDTPATDESQPEWKPAGIWYLAGSNTCVYSNPKDELGATQHVVQTSNRRFRDDEFLVPRDLTEGRSGFASASSSRRSPSAFPRPPAAGLGLERNSLHGLLLRAAARSQH